MYIVSNPLVQLLKTVVIKSSRQNSLVRYCNFAEGKMKCGQISKYNNVCRNVPKTKEMF